MSEQEAGGIVIEIETSITLEDEFEVGENVERVEVAEGGKSSAVLMEKQTSIGDYVVVWTHVGNEKESAVTATDVAVVTVKCEPVDADEGVGNAEWVDENVVLRIAVEAVIVAIVEVSVSVAKTVVAVVKLLALK